MTIHPTEINAIKFSSLHPGDSAVAIALGHYHTCVILTGGNVKCWGNSDYGQLGMGSSNTQYSPQNVGLGGLCRDFAHFIQFPAPILSQTLDLEQHLVCQDISIISFLL